MLISPHQKGDASVVSGRNSTYYTVYTIHRRILYMCLCVLRVRVCAYKWRFFKYFFFTLLPSTSRLVSISPALYEGLLISVLDFSTVISVTTVNPVVVRDRAHRAPSSEIAITRLRVFINVYIIWGQFQRRSGQYVTVYIYV